MQRTTGSLCFFLITAVFLLSRCANPVSPTGGPKDIRPPRVLSCTPPDFSTHFRGNSFSMDFDEFINLKSPATEIFISPPMKNQPETRLRGKTLTVKLAAPPDSNTTYSLNFGNAITDLTEGNILKGFRYVFATGATIDSLSLQGSLVDAFNLKPQKNIWVGLYLDNNDTLAFDSLPKHVPPYYVTKTDDNGSYLFSNLRDEKYRLFAVSDQNGDLIFNQPSEKIAFYDSLVKPYYIAVKRADTSKPDSTGLKGQKTGKGNGNKPASIAKQDSARLADSIIQAAKQYPSYPLFLFEETDSVQRLVKSAFAREGMAMFAFRFPLKKPAFIPLNFDSAAPWYQAEYSGNHDTVTLWITRPHTDSLVLKILTGQKTPDTVRLDLSGIRKTGKSRKKGTGLQLSASLSAASGVFNQFRDKLQLVFSYPLVKWDLSRVLLIADKDTLHPEFSFADSLKRRINIACKWKEDMSYRILIPDSVFRGILNTSHDTLRFAFKTRMERDFGNLILSVKTDRHPGQYIVQLMTESEAVVAEQIIRSSGKVRFDYMPAMKYKVKIIHDRNRNGHWDTGNYERKIQPEEVFYLPGIIEIRANWDVEENWEN